MSAHFISANLQVMGVVNATPDSFSDGGRFASPEQALAQAKLLIDEGADILDIGGESTRPGAREVALEIEIERTVPLIRAIREFSDLPISIDTNKPAVMRAAVEAGATLINSIWALRLDDSLAVAADLGVPVCLMHMRGTPRTMQQDPVYDDVVSEVYDFLAGRIEAAVAAGVHESDIIVDPGFGFGKTIEHNLMLLQSLARFRALGVPLLVGLSRKSTIGKITGKPVEDRLFGSIAAAVIAAMSGADILRVHDVGPTVDALAMVRAVGEAG
ncbi:MAG: dihydropteroate synthase [Gammaproteobacteria bacterium]|nr:dihydropteroate synthase [Gammaproteobacteria bacterium]